MKPPFHYEVRITKIRHISKDKFDFNITPISFPKENQLEENPLVSRQQSLDYYVNYISVLLTSLGHEYQSDLQSREILQSYIEKGNKDRIITHDHEDEISKSIFFGIGVFFINDKKKEEHKNKSEPIEEITDKELRELVDVIEENPLFFEEQLIHGFGYYGTEEILPENIIENLWIEMMTYKKNGFNIDDETVEVGLYNDESNTVDSLEILPTPFDWSGYDEPRENEEPSEGRNFAKKDINLKQIIQGGESSQVEFKSTLKYNLKTKSVDPMMKSTIGKTICGFLNTGGGFLFIGVDNEGKPLGLSDDFSLYGKKNQKDLFGLDFDNLLGHYLPQWVQDNILVDFPEIDGVEIFVVIVFPSKLEPVFFNGEKKEKEFYIRRTKSTKKMDVEDFFKYWRNHWGKKD